MWTLLLVIIFIIWHNRWFFVD